MLKEVRFVVDIDECENGTNNCGQNCSNTLGSYYCSCIDGYVLLSDYHNCFGMFGFYGFY